MTNTQKSQSATKHFILQRCTAVLLIPLILWLLYHVANFAHSFSAENLAIFLRHPVNFVLIVFFIMSFLYHAFLGMDDIMKDYIHCTSLYKTLRKILLLVSVFTYAVTVVNLLFFHMLFRYFTN
ncbi:MAG: succinate dehydrogenase / fumarate reductase membrane anchor subunit [Candidatus Midichloriaceae bacterium]|jgi:succinate dehydrogenase / fumarate reductase membrane anchor subunit